MGFTVRARPAESFTRELEVGPLAIIGQDHPFQDTWRRKR